MNKILLLIRKINNFKIKNATENTENVMSKFSNNNISPKFRKKYLFAKIFYTE